MMTKDGEEFVSEVEDDDEDYGLEEQGEEEMDEEA